MEKLINKSAKKIQNVNMDFTRSLYKSIHWERRLIGIKGARGTGKTTLLLQYLKKEFGDNEQVLYVSLDDVYFAANSLVDLIEQFVKLGGKVIALDEVHKYLNWSQEIKNLYDDYSDIKIVFTGSSILDIDKAEYDLSRRAVLYELPVLSLREFIALESGLELPAFAMEDVLNNHRSIVSDLIAMIKPLKEFALYNEYGAYPFYRNIKDDYYHHLNRVINLILETDVPSTISMDFNSIVKLKRFLYLLSESVPFAPNISKLSAAMGVTRDTVVKYLHYLEKAKLLSLVYAQGKGISKLAKPAKVYLENTNLMYALDSIAVKVGNKRETFFQNQLSVMHKIEIPLKGDFIIDSKFLFEIGGANKTYHQIANQENSYIVADDIEYGFGNKIPIWLFGFLY